MGPASTSAWRDLLRPRLSAPAETARLLHYVPAVLLVLFAAVASATVSAAATRHGETPAAAAQQRRYLGSFAYTVASNAPAYSQMWTADDWIAKDPISGDEYPWQSIIMVTGNDTAFAALHAEVLRRTGVALPVLWYWGGWRTDTSNPTTWNAFAARYVALRDTYPQLPPTPWGVYMGDEPDLARHPERQAMLHAGLDTVKTALPNATTYLNMLYGSIGCPGDNPGGPFLCNSSTWKGDPKKLALALGKMQLDWLSTDEYYDVSIEHYQKVYQQRLYPYLRPEQRIVLLPFAAYCEIGCPPNRSIAPAPADARCLGSAAAHLRWAESDPRVVALFIYRLKNLWQHSSMSQLDACENPWQTGLGLVDRCGTGGRGGYATPDTLKFYQRNVSKALRKRPQQHHHAQQYLAAAANGTSSAQRFCDPITGANNIAGDVAAPGDSSCVGPSSCVLFLGNFKTETACAAACAANSTVTDPCHSWTWHGMSFGLPWQGGCYGRHDMHWNPKMVSRDVVSAVSCKYPAPVPPPPPPPPPFVPGPYPSVKFSWDTVPVFFHSDNVTGPWSEESLRIIAKYPIVTTEKYTGPHGGSEKGPGNSTAVCCEEDRMLAALTAVKAHNKVR